MIDDDFESVFRRMIEQIMEAFGTFPEGSSIRPFLGSFVNEPLESQIELENDEPVIEKIDLGDSVLFLIQGHFDVENKPRIKVDGQKIIVTIGPEFQEIYLELGFFVDLEKSKVTYRNGVIEITVIKNESEKKSDGYMKIE
ncbi:MAG: hypothetical protein ACFFEE_03220 [Candidatus Thorarchaeota archaeon]